MNDTSPWPTPFAFSGTRPGTRIASPYSRPEPKPPSRQDRHTPNPDPFALMKEQSCVSRFSSPMSPGFPGSVLSIAAEKGVSVLVGPAGPTWIVVAHAASPRDRFAAVAIAAEAVHVPPAGLVANNFTTSAVGTAGVSVLLIKSCRADSDTSPFGVTGHEQQDTICSSGEKAYTLTQNAPVVAAVVPDDCPAPSAPVFVMLIVESPRFRFET